MEKNDNLLCSGVACYLRVGKTANDAKIVGFVDSFSGTKNIQLQSAMVCGEVEPVSIDAQGVSANLSVTGFVATKSVYDGEEEIAGKGKISLASFNPNSADYKSKTVTTKFPYMDFYDDKNDMILASFKKAMSSSFRITVNGGSYVKGDVQLQAISMSNGIGETKVYENN